MSEENSGAKPQGKGLAVTGFILGLVGMIFAVMIAGMVALSMASGGGKGLMYFWIVLCIAGTVMSIMGMMKLGKTGGKKGLGIAGLIIGIVATIWSVVLLMGLAAAEDVVNDAIDENVDLNDAMNELEDALNDLENLHIEL